MSLIAFVFLAPLLIFICAAVMIQDGGPPIFAHWRVGRGGKKFRCLKFRTMYVDAETRLGPIMAASSSARAEWLKDHKLREDPRVTPLGRFLRRSSLDEFPQILNVLQGEMSIVGPRPIVEAEMVRYGRYIQDYRRVRPGLTGLWQVSGRNDVTYRRRVAMDVVYCRSKSVLLDLKIIALTIPVILTGRGSY